MYSIGIFNIGRFISTNDIFLKKMHAICHCFSILFSIPVLFWKFPPRVLPHFLSLLFSPSFLIILFSFTCVLFTPLPPHILKPVDFLLWLRYILRYTSCVFVFWPLGSACLESAFLPDHSDLFILSILGFTILLSTSPTTVGKSWIKNQLCLGK